MAMSDTNGLSKAAAQVNRQLIDNLLDEQLFEYLLSSHPWAAVWLQSTT